jgi:hypothetical protein
VDGVTMAAGMRRSDLAAVDGRFAAEVGDQPDHDGGRPLEQTAVGDRVVSAAPDPAVAYREPARISERTTALMLATAVDAGDVGEVRRRVHEVQHRTGRDAADPWRLAAELCELMITRRASQPEATAAAAAETADIS